ncbi:hypothetical protein LUZ60_000345 [Juncus effusus]|nr:hypothetical protein LUZ60_000345 [Juncus effusus]
MLIDSKRSKERKEEEKIPRESKRYVGRVKKERKRRREMEKEGGEKEREERIEETVLEILKESDMESVTEHKIRAMAAERLALDLSVPHRKKMVRKVVESFLVSQQAEEDDKNKEEEEGEEEENQKEEDEEEEEGKGKKHYGYDDSGDLILCNLNNKRRVTLQEFRGKTLVSIREFYEKDGKQLPTSKGISLPVDQWKVLKDAAPAVEDAIKKLQGF